MFDWIDDTACIVVCNNKSVVDEIINALKLLTHDKNTPYMEYVGEIKKNSIAKKVKLADLRHNSDLTRLDVVDEKALKRKMKYEKAIKFLEE